MAIIKGFMSLNRGFSGITAHVFTYISLVVVHPNSRPKYVWSECDILGFVLTFSGQMLRPLVS